MTSAPSQLPGWIAAYAARLHAAVGSGHQVASPLGAWLLLALAAPASTGADRDSLTEVLGCDPDAAAGIAAALLADPHPLVASAVAAWTAAGARLGPAFERWRSELPPRVSTGDLPGAADRDAWARQNTFGLIERFPVQDSDDLVLVLASALATKVSWMVPFELAPAASLGTGSPWAGRLSRVLRTPAQSGGGHVQYIAVTPDAGDVIVHVATAAGGLLVISAGAAPGVPAGPVLAAAHRLGIRHAAGAHAERRSLSELPLGDGPLWRLREVTAPADTCIAVLPAWSASSKHKLTDPQLGFAAVSRSLVPRARRWDAAQAAMARYSRTGFEAAAVTGFAITSAARAPATRREAELRFAYPYAVVAVTTDGGAGTPDAGARGPWHGLPVFSAWVSHPEDAADDSDSAPGWRR
jgi:hypothetical protein